MVVASQSITVKLGFGEPSGPSADPVDALSIDTPKDGTDSIYVIKEKIAKAAGGAVRPEDLLLSFGPTDRKLGAQFVGDPTVDERALTLDKFSILAWLERFPHWGLTVRLLPPTPPAPGTAPGCGRRAAQRGARGGHACMLRVGERRQGRCVGSSIIR